jgi:hypothetical protein
MGHWNKYRELRRASHLVALCASLVVLSLGSTGNAATIHVDGTAQGPGDGSPSSPFRTINRAVVAAAPGDATVIRSRSYPEKLTIRKQLTSSASGGPGMIGLDRPALGDRCAPPPSGASLHQDMSSTSGWKFFPPGLR